MNNYCNQFIVPAFGSPMQALENCPTTLRLFDCLVSKTQAPWDLVLISTLSTYSILLQGIIDVERPGVGKGPVSLFTLGIADSGERKSTIGSLLERPIIKFQSNELNRYEDELKTFEVKKEIYEREKGHLKEENSNGKRKCENIEDISDRLDSSVKSEPKRPKVPRIIFEDATPESLACDLYEGFGNASLISNEGNSILNGRIIHNLAFLNKLWAGESWTVSRKNSKSFVVSDSRLSVSIMVQTKALASFMRKKGDESRDIGFLARFLVCQPISTQGFRFLSPNQNNDEPAYQMYLDRAEEFLSLLKDRMLNPDSGRETICFTPEASNFWIWLYNYIEMNLQSGGRFQYARDHGSKLAEIIARIAALLSSFELGVKQEINFGMLRDAAKIAFYYSDVFLGTFSLLPDYLIDEKSLREYFQIIREGGQRYLRKNRILQSGPLRLRKKAVLDPTLLRLIGAGEIAIITLANAMLVIDLYPNYPPDHVQWAAMLNQN